MWSLRRCLLLREERISRALLFRSRESRLSCWQAARWTSCTGRQGGTEVRSARVACSCSSSRVATGQGSKRKVRENDTKMLKSQGNLKLSSIFELFNGFLSWEIKLFEVRWFVQAKVREIDIEILVATLNSQCGQHTPPTFCAVRYWRDCCCCW